MNVKLSTLAVKIVWLQKTLDQVNCYTSEKTNCLVTKLNNDNDEIKNENDSFDIQQLINSILSFF